MELYTLDSLLRRNTVVDQYESLIWTERFASTGDFELVIPSSTATRNLFGQGQLLAMNESNRVMQVESVADADDSEGRSLLTVTGPSLEDVLDDRGSRPADSVLVKNADGTLQWEFKDTPTAIARAIFKAICVDGNYSPYDVIPFITTGNLYPPDTLPEIDQSITYDVDIAGSVLKAIEDLASKYGFGYRLTRNLDTSQLFFNIYTGSDRTTNQTNLPPVIFSPKLGNMTDTSYLTTSTGMKNTAVCIRPDGTTLIVYGNGADVNVSGFDRRVIMVDASGVDSTLKGDALDAAVAQKGMEALASARSMQGVDGSISQYSQYKYGIDYNLGDLVQQQNDDGITNNMKVTEQIFTCDENGERSYPTLSADIFITPGSWFSSEGAHQWVDATGTWAQG